MPHRRTGVGWTETPEAIKPNWLEAWVSKALEKSHRFLAGTFSFRIEVTFIRYILTGVITYLTPQKTFFSGPSVLTLCKHRGLPQHNQSDSTCCPSRGKQQKNFKTTLLPLCSSTLTNSTWSQTLPVLLESLLKPKKVASCAKALSTQQHSWPSAVFRT